jgi:uncharacterized protein HemX
MLELAAQLVIPLVIAMLIGFVCAWLLQRQAVQKSCRECREARQRLEDMTSQLQAFREKEKTTARPESRLKAYETELRVLENELETMLGELKDTRRDIEQHDSHNLHYLFRQA